MKKNIVSVFMSLLCMLFITITAFSSSLNTSDLVTIEINEEDTALDWGTPDQVFNLADGDVSIEKSGVYELTGSTENGIVSVNVDKNADEGSVVLILNNVAITSVDSAPINVIEAQKVILYLPEGTSSSLTQAETATVNAENEPDAALFSNADLTISGSGALTVNGNYKDGIKGKDSLLITGGILAVNAVSDGITGKDELLLENAEITVQAGKDGVNSTNSTDVEYGNILIASGVLTVTAANDGIQAENNLQISGGTITLTTGGGSVGAVRKQEGFGGGNGGPGGMARPEDMNADSDSVPEPPADGFNPMEAEQTTEEETTESMKGLKAGGSMLIENGELTISSVDDSLHAGTDVIVNGGTLSLASDDDGIHADGSVTFNGGTITISGSYEGIEGINITLNNGTIVLSAVDDGVNVNDRNGVLTLAGGALTLDAGGDGLDSNGAVVMSGGTVIVSGPEDSGNGALDYDLSFAISGGTLAVSGASGMAQAPDDTSIQCSVSMEFTETQAAGTTITLKNADGENVAEMSGAKTFNSVVFSSPEIKQGESYTVYNGETAVVTFTQESVTTWVNESGVTSAGSGMGFPGGAGGGKRR